MGKEGEGQARSMGLQDQMEPSIRRERTKGDATITAAMMGATDGTDIFFATKTHI